MATLKYRKISFTFEGIKRTGIIIHCSPLGGLLVNITDGIDDTKQIALPPD